SLAPGLLPQPVSSRLARPETERIRPPPFVERRTARAVDRKGKRHRTFVMEGSSDDEISPVRPRELFREGSYDSRCDLRRDGDEAGGDDASVGSAGSAESTDSVGIAGSEGTVGSEGGETVVDGEGAGLDACEENRQIQ
ncbi:hypothetical protein ACHAWF_007965, partial [Thalassiosira exigua]